MEKRVQSVFPPFKVPPKAAYVMRQEDRVGSIEVGKLADLVVLDRYLFETATGRIRDTKVRMTFLDGIQIYPQP